MKKVFPLVLVLVLLLTVSATAFASDIADAETLGSQDVLASYEAGAQDKTVVSVDISWNQLSFTYKGASEQIWDAANHQYTEDAAQAGWVASDATITVTNHSNSILQAAISYVPESVYSGIFMCFTADAPYVGSAYTSDTEAGTACSVTVKVIPDGELPDDTADKTKIGVITVKVISDIDAVAAVDAIGAAIAACPADDSGLERGGVYFAAGTDKQALLEQADAATMACNDENLTAAEKNVIVNALITAFYGALDIVQ